MKLFGYELTLKRKQLGLASAGWGGLGREWWPLFVHEPYAGAWQRNDPQPVESVLSNTTVFRCISLIAADIGKMDLQLMQEDSDGIGRELETPMGTAFSSVLEQPNRYQNSQQFFEQWMYSKLINGNTYVYKSRDNRNVVDELHILDPNRTRPLSSPADGAVFYEIRRDALAGINQDSVTVPASEIIHDRWNNFYHPLWGLPPIYANHLPASQANKILKYSDRFFGNAARPSGVLTAPGIINKDTADRLKAHWEQNYNAEQAGRVAVLGDGLKWEAMTQNAVDAELVKQLELSDRKICTSFGVPPFKIGVEGAPAYDNVEAMEQVYYSGGLQTHIEAIEDLIESGLELPSGYYVEFNLQGLLRMDTTRKVEAYAKMVASGIVSPNEARAEFDYGPVNGGETPYLQQQYYPLDKRPSAAPPTPPTGQPILAPPAMAKEFEKAINIIRGEFARV